MSAGERKRFLIFGASGGIGTELCLHLVSQGDEVIAAGRSKEKLRNVGSDLGIETIQCDATDFGQVEETVKAASSKLGKMNGVAHCVGSILLKPAHLTREDEWRDVMDTNLTSAFAVLRAAANQMRGDGGSIVLVSSAASQIGLPNHEAIAAAKAGVVGLAISAAASYAKMGIRVNAVAPGLVETPLTERITSRESSRKASEAMHPLGRLGKPDDVAEAIAWLLGPRSDWITGQVIGIDGGLANIKLN